MGRYATRLCRRAGGERPACVQIAIRRRRSSSVSANRCTWPISLWRQRAPKATKARGNTSSASTGRSCIDRLTPSMPAAAPASWRIPSTRSCTVSQDRGRLATVTVSLLPRPEQSGDLAARRTRAASRRHVTGAAPRRAARRRRPRTSGSDQRMVSDPDCPRLLSLVTAALARAISRLSARDKLRLAFLLCAGPQACGDRTSAGRARGDGVTTACPDPAGPSPGHRASPSPRDEARRGRDIARASDAP